MSEFDVILGMDWLMAHCVIIDCDRMRVPAYKGWYSCYVQGDKHDTFPQALYDSRWHEQLTGWLVCLTLQDEMRQDLSLPHVVCEYEDVYPEELQGLPLYRDVDFMNESHPSTMPISMTSHRMALIEL